MAKLVCQDCGEVIERGVDPDAVDPDEINHDHSDPPAVSDRRTDAPDTVAGDDGDDTPDAGESEPGVDPDDGETDGDAEAGEAETGGEGGDTDGMDTPGSADPEAHDSAHDPLDGGDGTTVRNDTQQEVDAGEEPEADTYDPAEELAEMDEADRERSSASWNNVDPDTDYTEVDEEFQRRYDNIREEVEQSRTLEGEMAKARDKHRDSNRHGYSCGSERLKNTDRWQDLRDDIIEAFGNLKTRDAPTPSRRGDRINMDAVVQRAAGDKAQDRLFTKQDTIATGDRLVGVSVDMSGSMSEKSAKLAVAAICEAARIIGDDVVANCWRGDRDAACAVSNHGSSVGLMVGPDEQFEWSALDAFETGGSTPTADGIHNLRKIMQDRHAAEKVMIVVTDGSANGNLSVEGTRTTGNAVEDAARECRKARADGMKVVGLGVGRVSEEPMRSTFGSGNFAMADMSNLADHLVSIYRNQLDV